jgi:hypothetical protein
VGIQFIPVQRNEIEPVTIADFIELYEPPVHPYCSVYVQ